LIAEGRIQAKSHSLVGNALVQLTLKYGLLVSAALVGITSVAIYVVAYLLFTIHEEIGIPPNVALHLAQWTFPAVFLASFVGYWLWKAGPK
jgi:hypothetical protein